MFLGFIIGQISVQKILKTTELDKGYRLVYKFFEPRSGQKNPKNSV
jgi:hypothetical protein